jgi:ubiquinone/menaquinone biosynthesis C-methylase UbiE
MATQISRVNRSKEQAQSSYNRISAWYDLISGGSEKKYRDLGLQKLNAQPGERILELGFGTGHCILALAQAVGLTGKVYGIDISAGMLKIAQERLQKAALAERVELRLGDAAHLPFEPGMFDAIFTSFTLELFDTPEIPVVLQACYHVLRPGGRICVVSMSKGDKPTPAITIYEWFHQRLPSLVDCRPIYAQASLQEAGFHLLDTTQYSMWGLPVDIVLAQKITHDSSQ